VSDTARPASRGLGSQESRIRDSMQAGRRHKRGFASRCSSRAHFYGVSPGAFILPGTLDVELGQYEQGAHALAPTSHGSGDSDPGPPKVYLTEVGPQLTTALAGF
jgi:hypothetical protein